MGGFDNHVGVMGDWMPPSPSPRSFFSSMLDSDYDHGSSGNADQRNENETSLENDEPEFRSRRGLMERIAARAGFNTPRLNTQAIRPTELSKKPEIRSPYLTVSPGLSPTTFLESPVFLSNSMVLPSPTTGKFSFAPIGNNQNSTLTRNIDPDKGKENTDEDVNDSSFAFKPISESTSFPYFSPLFQHPNLSKPYTDNNGGNHFSTEQTYNSVGVAEHSPPFDEDDRDRTTNGDPNVAEDCYNWRKYGQKHIKGSEHPRSYYKCTHQNCPVKKKVERSQEAHITEIIYKGAHDHPNPPSNRILALGSTNELGDMQLECEQQWKPKNLEAVTSSAAQLCQEYGNGSSNSNLQAQSQTGDVVDVSSTISNDGDDDDDRATHGSVSLGGYDGEGDELESKRRRIEAYAPEMGGASRGIREPRVVVQTTSEVDILDDGYRWRKYGQKIVKGNPNHRSYYKCTSPGCNVRKHVERACHDLKSVITTYEGKHNHDIPPARNTSQQGPNRGQFERPSMASSFNLPNRLTQLGPRLGFGVGMHQHGLGMNPYFVPEMGYVLPKGELEPVTQTGLNSSNGSSVYQQMMSRLPLGPHM